MSLKCVNIHTFVLKFKWFVSLPPVVNLKLGVYGYEATINITSDTTYIIRLEVVV